LTGAASQRTGTSERRTGAHAGGQGGFLSDLFSYVVNPLKTRAVLDMVEPFSTIVVKIVITARP
jgi:hypothetical protein